MKTLNKTSLFWDAEKINPGKNKRFIIERILELGDVDDFRWAVSFYTKEDIKNALLKSRKLSKKSANFWKAYFNINSKEWNKNRSPKQLSAFWNK